MSASMAAEAASGGPDGPGEPRAMAFAARAQKMHPRAGGMLAAEQAESESGPGYLHGRAPAGGARRRRTAQDPGRPVRRRRGPRLPDRPGPRARGVPAATVTNGTLLLLPGRARIFHGTQFVGETHLDTVAPGEEFEVQLGVDDQIKVERKLRRHSVGKALLGGTRTIDIGYEITVENHRDRDV